MGARGEAYLENRKPRVGDNATARYVEALDVSTARRHAQIRELVIEHRRFDILARFVLGYDPMWFHMDMMQFQEEVDEGLILAWRGAAKTSYCTITAALGEIVCDANVRILFASNAAEQAKTIMRGVKNHMMQNQEFIAIFGDLVTGADRWAEHEITVNNRTSLEKEATITCIGTETALPTRHFDIIYCDDLVTKDSAGTEGQRKKVFEWFYETLLPTKAKPHGRLYVIGTRWHQDDLHGYLLTEDYKGSHITIPVLDDNDRSVWEEMFSTAEMHRIRKANLRAFELQYMMRAGQGSDAIFLQENFDYYDTLPPGVNFWQGVDPAISQKDRAAHFGHCTVAIHKESRKPYLVSFHERKLPFPRQLKMIADQFDAHPETWRVVVESNAYQLAVKQQMAQDYPHVPIKAAWTVKDKVARANQLVGIVGDKGIMIRRQHHKFLRRLCDLPGSKRWDLFDAFYFAVIQGLRGIRRRRREEDDVGLI